MLPEVAKLLHEYGGWGVAAALLYVILRLIKHIEKRETYIDSLHKEQRDDNKEMVEALITTRNAVGSLKEVFLLFTKNQLPPSDQDS